MRDTVMALASLVPALICLIGAVVCRLRDKDFWWFLLVVAILVMPTIRVSWP
jgi:hypothetical protein